MRQRKSRAPPEGGALLGVAGVVAPRVGSNAPTHRESSAQHSNSPVFALISTEIHTYMWRRLPRIGLGPAPILTMQISFEH
ncbi:hypothetical protein HNP00_000775 [Arthrobacter sp. AZCC_0090]|nr:hypothetical protein [Arthrobacter sp. AZCC_0090]